MKTEIEKYIVAICADNLKRANEIQKWIDTHWDKIKDKPQSDIEHVIDYLAQNDKKLQRATYPQMHSMADKWTKSLQKKGKNINEIVGKDVEILKDFGDGFTIVKLVSKESYEREGYLMRHCVASYFGKETEIHSLRDKDNMPHATLEHGQQIKGKGNGSINPKYIKYVVEWLEHIGVQVRESEMKNLGYYDVAHINDIEIPKELLFNDRYLFKGDLDKIPNKDTFFMVKIFGMFNFNSKLELKYNFDIQKCRDFLCKKIKSAVGDNSQSAVGDNGDLTVGKNCVMAMGKNSKVKGCMHAWIQITEWLDEADENGNEIKGVHGFHIDGKNYMPDTYYTIKNGEIVETD